MRTTQQQARDWFAGARVARLGTTGQDGQPHLVPVTFAVVGEEIAIAVDHKPKRTTALRRLRNIEENPGVALLADHYEDDWSQLWWVRVDGLAGIRDAADRPELVDALAAKYAQYRRQRPDEVLIAITAQRWSGWHA
jgi:PPOX class probable F420-dependent enzyme